MKTFKIIIIAMLTPLIFASCGGGTTDEYPTDTTGLNTESGLLDSNIAPMAGTRGNPENSIGGDTILNDKGQNIEAKAPDSNATNPNIRK